MVKAAIAIGSNIGDPSRNVRRAFERLSEVGKVVAQSSLYQTKPWGVLDQSDFINAAAIVETVFTPMELLEKLLSIELSMGRERKEAERWGPRVIDLDILTFGDVQVDEPKLKIPHRFMFERAFVLAPLAEIDATYLEALERLPAESQAEVVRLQNSHGEEIN
jgi:2-amino-4-hydroxy-6-hydroxymethyldihydropteridine diphosphokinase